LITCRTIVDGGTGIGDSKFWDVQATATWDFWEWGRTRYGVKERLSRLSQAKLRKEQILDNIELEVKQAFLRTKESENNIVTIEKAIEQAKENLRITEERYKEQVSTTTDVLVAQTLFTQTMTNYYNALYDFKIAKAILYRAVGQEVME
jgi:outer membrane protein